MTTPTRKELTLKRTFAAPLQKVWNAWTNPKEVQKWWGPNDFTNPRCEWDAIPGGDIYIAMTAPDGTEYPMDGEFLEVDQPRRLKFKSRALVDGKPLFEDITTVTLEESNGKTMMTLHTVVENITPEIAKFTDGMGEGWNQSLDKLTTLLK